MTRIENEKQYRAAVERVEELLPIVTEETPTDDKNFVELLLLSDLVADYSDVHFAIGEPSLMDIVKLRMYEKGLTQRALAELLGVSPSRVNDIISGRSEPTFKMARDISKKLDIDPAIVLGV